MPKKRVAVMRGGRGTEYEISLSTGKHILDNLPDSCSPLDLLITKEGEWFLNGFRIAPAKLARYADVVWNALHEGYGEEGRIQQTLQRFGIPHTGSYAFPGALALNKERVKDIFRKHGFKTPASLTINPDDDITESAVRIIRTITPPYVVKPIFSGSSLGLTVAKSFDDLERGIIKASMYSPKVLVEEYVRGSDVACAVIEGGDRDLYATHPVEAILPSGEKHMDYKVKCGAAGRVCYSGEIGRDTAREMQEAAKIVHHELGLRHYSKTDAIKSKNGLYFLEINSLPSITPNSPFMHSLNATGFELPEFIDYIVTLALQR